MALVDGTSTEMFETSHTSIYITSSQDGKAYAWSNWLRRSTMLYSLSMVTLTIRFGVLWCKCNDDQYIQSSCTIRWMMTYIVGGSSTDKDAILLQMGHDGSHSCKYNNSWRTRRVLPMPSRPNTSHWSTTMYHHTLRSWCTIVINLLWSLCLLMLSVANGFWTVNNRAI